MRAVWQRSRVWKEWRELAARPSPIAAHPKSLRDLLAHPMWKGSTVADGGLEHVAECPWGMIEARAITRGRNKGKFEFTRGIGPSALGKVFACYLVTHKSGATARIKAALEVCGCGCKKSEGES